MIPAKVKIVSIVTLILALLIMFITSLSILVLLSTPLLWIVALILLIPLIGSFILLVSAILMLIGKKAGFYFYLVGWILNLPSTSNLVGIALFAWVIFSFYMIRNDLDSRKHLNLSNNWFEKPWAKKP